MVEWVKCATETLNMMEERMRIILGRAYASRTEEVSEETISE